MTTAELSSERAAFLAVQRQLLDETDLDIRPRRIQLEGGPTLQVLEAGEGDPLVLLHGAGSSSVLMIPLMEQLKGRRLIAVDRPGYGMSDPVDYRTGDFRRSAVDVMTGLLDAMDLDKVDLLGNSLGGIWSLWLALARPERLRRLALVGAVPLLPGTRIPLPLKIFATPGVGELMNRMMTPSPSSVMKEMVAMGEGETFLNYPLQIDAFVAAGSDPVANKTVLDEFRALGRPWGFRPERLFTEEDLGRVSHPSLFIWGDRDPFGGPEVARRATGKFPNAQLEVLSAGHGPGIGDPHATAQLVTSFLNGDHI
jgi:pimeloyl-ACP methyl ester carboxylesterase